ncbi:hypothetical protein [Micromonospora carbonacea]|uniref:hypothetical protein n=1 Tax=Micromonospora carbonacea TaxID=47853 RepID=UPI0009430986|nr:hypothetical protein [Micromonospora carbonacea]
MSDEILDKLRRLHQYTADLNGLLASVQAQAPPEEATGTDPSGAVQVKLGPDGLPTDIRVMSGWQPRVEPQDLGQAVLAAFQAAVAEGQRAWSEGFDGASWLAEAERVERRAEDRYEGEALAPLPPAPVYGQPRDPLAMTEDVLKALQAVRTRGVQPPAPASGRNRERTVSITLSPGGLQGCEIEPRWAAREGAAGVNSGLSEALAQAHAVLRGQAAQGEAEAANLDALAREALATLASLTNVDRRGERR